MAKGNEGEVDQDVELDDLPGEPGEGQKDETDWKALAQKNHGIAKRLKTKLEKAKTKPEGEAGDGKKVETKQPEAGTLDRMDLAVLRLEKITDEEEVKLITSVMKDTGKTLEQVLASKYFQAELKEMRDLKKTDDATPEGTKRAGNSTKDQVDYWIAKGELPPASQAELRTKVVNAKIAKEKAGNQFSSNPIQ